VDTNRRDGDLRALVLGTLAFALCFAVWGSVAPMAPVFRGSYRLNATGVGFLIAVPVLLGSLARIPLGILTDRYGARTVYPALMAALIVPALLMGVAGSYPALLGTTLLLGLAGASFAVGVPLVAKWFPASRQGLALGIYGVGNIGTAVAAMMGPRLAARFGLAAAYWVYVPLLALFAVAFWLFVRDAPGAIEPGQSLGQRLAILKERPVSWVLVLFYFVTFGGFVALGSFLPTYLVTRYGLTLSDAGARTAGFVVVATLSRPLGGYASDRWGGVRTLNIAFFLVAAFSVALAFEGGMPTITVAFLSVAFALGLGSGAVFKLVAEHFPAQTGLVGGLVGTGGGLGGFFPPIVMGVVKDVTGSYAIGFMLLSEFALGCLIVNLLALGRASAASGPARSADQTRPGHLAL
jgi:MFS transporter, NNP family, nitrate/nitrite transporter